MVSIRGRLLFKKIRYSNWLPKNENWVPGIQKNYGEKIFCISGLCRAISGPYVFILTILGRLIFSQKSLISVQQFTGEKK